jgi:hypothetical protein
VAYTFNPFTGNLDAIGSGGGSSAATSLVLTATDGSTWNVIVSTSGVLSTVELSGPTGGGPVSGSVIGIFPYTLTYP